MSNINDGTLLNYILMLNNIIIVCLMKSGWGYLLKNKTYRNKTARKQGKPYDLNIVYIIQFLCCHNVIESRTLNFKIYITQFE